MKITDAQILKGLSDENPKVFEAIYVAEWPGVLGYVIKNNGTQDDAREVISEAMMMVFKKVTDGGYQDQGKFSAYFFSVAANIWLMKLRKAKNSVTTIALTEHLLHLSDEGWDDTYAKLKDEQLNALYRAIQRLDKKCSDLIRKFHLESIPLLDIAAEWGMSYEAVRKRIFDCRKRLKVLSNEELKKGG